MSIIKREKFQLAWLWAGIWGRCREGNPECELPFMEKSVGMAAGEFCNPDEVYLLE